MPSSSTVKLTAKTALKGKYFTLVAVCSVFVLSYYIVSLCASYITQVFSLFLGIFFQIVVNLFVTVPLLLGIIKYVWRMLFSSGDNIISVFAYFSSFKEYKKAIGLIFTLVIKLGWAAILFYLPSIILNTVLNDRFLIKFDLVLPLWAVNLSNLSWILTVAASVLLVIYSLKYILSPFILASNESFTPMEALFNSKRILINRKSDLLGFALSFVGWLLLCLLLFPIPFILPYVLTSFAVFTRFAVAGYNKTINTEGEEVYNYTVM